MRKGRNKRCILRNAATFKIQGDFFFMKPKIRIREKFKGRARQSKQIGVYETIKQRENNKTVECCIFYFSVL